MKCIKMFLGNIVTIALPGTPMTGLVSPLGATFIYSLIVSLLRPFPDTPKIVLLGLTNRQTELNTILDTFRFGFG